MPTVTFPLITFCGQPAIKDEFMARMEAHRAAEDLIRGPIGRATSPVWKDTGTSEWRGYPADCLFHDKADPHGAAERQIGLPRLLGRLLDAVFRGLPKGRYTVWPSQFLAAIPVGADLSGVWPRLAGWLLTDAQAGIIRFAQTDGERAAIQAVATHYTRVLSGKRVLPKAWLAARQAANESAATILASIQAANDAFQAASDAHYIAVTDAYNYRTTGAADAVDAVHAAALAATFAAATTAAEADVAAARSAAAATYAGAAPAHHAALVAAHAASAAQHSPTANPAHAADVASAAAAADNADATVCTVNAAEAFAIAAYIAAGRSSSYAPDDQTYLAAYTSYYDALADKLLVLLAAAPVLALQGVQQSLTRERPRQ